MSNTGKAEQQGLDRDKLGFQAKDQGRWLANTVQVKRSEVGQAEDNQNNRKQSKAKYTEIKLGYNAQKRQLGQIKTLQGVCVWLICVCVNEQQVWMISQSQV